MAPSDQTLAEFAALTFTGVAVSVAAAILVTDYRGFLTSYARGCRRFYQCPGTDGCSCGPPGLVPTTPTRPGFGAGIHDFLPGVYFGSYDRPCHRATIVSIVR
jgi:hypothetical protein